MTHKHPAEKHHPKKHWVGKDHVRRQETMASIKSPAENSNPSEVKQNREVTHPSKTDVNETNQEALSFVKTETPSQPEQTALHPLETLEIQCKKIAEHLQRVLKHLF